MKVLIVDNYDSFTFNLYQYVGEILLKHGEKFSVDVIRNDELSLEQIRQRNYDRIIISPGPGDPSDRAYFGVCSEVLLRLSKKTPILGVCLGMQGMAYVYGANVIRAKEPMHGKASSITHDERGLFKALPQGLEVMRYHSLVVEIESLPEILEISATAADTGEIMGLRHKTLPIEGIQFHPESFRTEGGKAILHAFLYSRGK